MDALPRPGQERKLPPPERVVQVDDHRCRRGAHMRPAASPPATMCLTSTDNCKLNFAAESTDNQ